MRLCVITFHLNLVMKLTEMLGLVFACFILFVYGMSAGVHMTTTAILIPDSGFFNYSYCCCSTGREGGGIEERVCVCGGGDWCFLRKAALQIDYVCVPSGSIHSVSPSPIS